VPRHALLLLLLIPLAAAGCSRTPSTKARLVKVGPHNYVAMGATRPSDRAAPARTAVSRPDWLLHPAEWPSWAVATVCTGGVLAGYCTFTHVPFRMSLSRAAARMAAAVPRALARWGSDERLRGGRPASGERLRQGPP
jgi:hypothetical protein